MKLSLLIFQNIVTAYFHELNILSKNTRNGEKSEKTIKTHKVFSFINIGRAHILQTTSIISETKYALYHCDRVIGE
jgi:hypothetical protein